jgi:hypothetical protein
MYPPMGLFIRTSKSNVVPAADDMANYRIIAMMAGSGLAVNAGQDFGLEFTQAIGTAGRVVADANSGWGLRIQDVNTVQFITRGGNGLVTVTLTTAPFDTSVWHVYEFRISSATDTVDAKLELRIDNAVVANLGALNTSWAAGTNLPFNNFNLGNMGFMTSLVSAAGNNNSLFVHQLRFQAGPSFIMTL